MDLLFTTPYQRPAIDGYATITGVRIISCLLNPDT